MKAFSGFKRIAFLAAVLMLTSCFSVFADSTVYTEDVFWYTIGSEDSITITGCFGRDDVINVPSIIAGKPVNHIAAGAFVDCLAKVINLPDTIMDVEEGAFRPEATVNWRVNASDQVGGSDEDSGGKSPGRPNRPGNDGNDNDDSGNDFYDNGKGSGSVQTVDSLKNGAAEGNDPEGGAAIEVNIDEDALEKNRPDSTKGDANGNGSDSNGTNVSGEGITTQAAGADGNGANLSDGDNVSPAETDTGAIDFVDGPGMVKETKSNIGMILGIIAGIALLFWIIWFFFIKRRKKDKEEKEATKK